MCSRSYNFALFFLVLAAAIRAQSFTEEALDKLYINAIARDHLGRIWLGTPSGLHCYDGSQLIGISDKSGHVKLSGVPVTGLAFNAQTRKIIATTARGIDFFDPESFENQIFHATQLQVKNPAKGFSFPSVDAEGNTWCSDNHDALIRFDRDLRHKIISIKHPVDSLLLYKYGQEPGMRHLNCLGKKILFGNSHSMACEYEAATDQFRVISLDHRAITGVYNIANEKVIADFSGLHFISESDTSLRSLVPTSLITFTYLDANGELWYVLDKIRLMKLNAKHQAELVYELSAEQINRHKAIRCFLTNDENIWLATERGLIRINKPLRAFSKILDKLPGYEPVELSSRGIVMRNDSTLICAGYNYLAAYRPLSNTVIPLLSKKAAQYLVPYALLVSKDSLWVGSEGAGLKLLDLNRGGLKKIVYKNKIARNYFTERGLIVCMTKIDSLIFLGEYGQLGVYNLRSKNVSDSYSPAWPYSFSREATRYIFQILELNRQELLFVCQGQIIITDRKLNVLRSISPPQANESASAYFVLNVMVDRDKRFWISTRGSGLCCYDPKSRISKWYTTADGLCDNTVYYTLQSDDGRLWAATNYGLSVIDPAASTIHNYFEKDGLANNEFNTNSYLKAPNGDLYLGGMKGVTRIVPSLLLPVKRDEKFLLTSISLAGENQHDSLILAGLQKIKEIRLPYHARFLKVQFSLLNFSAANRYAFRLLGLDTAWVNLENNNSVIFNSLSPGSYTLEVKAWNDRGELHSGIIALPIESEQVFYKKAWFIILSLSLLLAFMAFVFYTIYRVKLRAVDEMARMRLKIATNLHDEVGGLLSKTAMQADMVQMKPANHEHSLAKIADNSRAALSSMRDILWNLDPRNDTPESLAEIMRDYAHQMLEDSNSYELNLAALTQVKLTHEVRQEINTVFKEAINNIVKHARNERVRVHAELAGAELRLSVHNTGSFKQKENHHGQGLRNMQMRMEKIGGRFHLSGNDGVTLLFCLPLKNKQFT